MTLRLHAVPTALLTLLAIACGPSTESAAPVAADAYQVRGEIVRLPAAPGGDLFLHHEAIPDFRDSKGETVGMMSMTMPFTAAESVDLSGLAPGDRVAVDFEVRWAPKPALLVTRLEPLPQGTRLGFDPEEPESSSDDPAAEAASDADDAPDASR